METPTNPTLPKDVFVVEKEGKYLVLNPSVPAWVVTNRNGAAALQLCDGTSSVVQVAERLAALAGRNVRSEALEFLREAQRLRIFDARTSPPTYSLCALKNVHLSLTDGCNLSCIYCYATDRVSNESILAYDDWLGVLDSLRQLSGNCTVTFTGGEPLLSKHAVPLAIDAKRLELSTFLLTNGTLIDKNNVDCIADVFDSIKISVDGSTAAVHEATRGRGSYGPTMRAIELLAGRGVRPLLSMTVTSLNIHDVEEMARKFGPSLSFAPLFPAGRANVRRDLSITGDQYYSALSSAAGVNPCAGLLDSLDCSSPRVLLKCSMGDGSISIGSNGDVYPCHLLHCPEFRSGNVRDTPLEDIYHSSPVLNGCKRHTVLNIDKCKACPVRLICGGGCLARHYHETGSLERTGDFCSYEKASIINGLLETHVFQA